MRAMVLSMGGLAALQHKAAAEPIRTLLSQSTGRIQAAAAHALQSLGSKADVDALLTLAAGKFETFVPARTMALETLTKLDPKRAVSVAVRLVDHPSRAVGRAALKVIAAAPLRWSLPVVKFGLQTPGLRGNAALAAVAHKALGREVLIAALSGDLTTDERSWLLHALSQLKPLGASEALIGRFDKLTNQAKIEILKALPLLKDQTVVPTLVRTLEASKAPVANYVVYALENVTGERLGDNVDAWRSYAGFDKEPPSAPVEGP
ncbi:MAG TPA: hypothetical protein DCQ06_14075 [Myxococcales bacterium]|nr:hypothetical protein [Myxococcales bacterium]